MREDTGQVAADGSFEVRLARGWGILVQGEQGRGYSSHLQSPPAPVLCSARDIPVTSAWKLTEGERENDLGLFLLETASQVYVTLEIEHLSLPFPFLAFQKLLSSSLGKAWRVGLGQAQEVSRKSKSPQGCPRG